METIPDLNFRNMKSLPRTGIGTGSKGLRNLGWQPLLARLKADLERAATEHHAPRDEPAWSELRRRVDYLTRAFARRPFERTNAPLSATEQDDVVQDVCVRLHKARVLAQLGSARKPAGYLVTMIRNAARDMIRKRRKSARELIHLDDEFASMFLVARSPNVEPTTVRTQGVSALQRALAQLSDEDVDLLDQHYALGRDLKEIATAHGTSYSATATRLSRVRARLRRLITDDRV
jgi:RNA polymerase sigma factor (sigma-70 family)